MKTEFKVCDTCRFWSFCHQLPNKQRLGECTHRNNRVSGHIADMYSCRRWKERRRK